MLKFETSVKVLESRLSENPRSLVFSRLADRFRESGDIQQAVSVCMQGLAHHPDCLTARMVLGKCYLAQEKLKEAAAEFVRVIKIDKRNQSAVKLIADICARQGIQTKAGDLYSFLLSTDPDNQSFVELSTTFRGSGETDVFGILGIAAPRVQMQRRQEAPAAEEVIEDADRTMKYDFGPRRAEEPVTEEADAGEILAKTQRFDRTDIDASEPVGESLRLDEDVLTGDDVSLRMDTLFETGGEAAPPAPPESHEHIELGVKDEEPPVSEDAGAAIVGGDEGGVVSGSDISSRIDQLFGEEIPMPPPEPSIATAPTQEVALDELRPVESAVFSGDDIASRLNEMFKDEPDAEPLEFETMPQDKTAFSDDTKVGPVLESKAKSPARDVTDATEEIVLGTHAPSDQGALSGDDVAERLETIFDVGEGPGVRPPDATDLSVPEDGKTQAADSARPEEDTKPPVDIEEVAVEETAARAPAETPPAREPETAPQDREPSDTPTIDAAVADGEDEAEPGMSGDDVVGRMEEIFVDEAGQGSIEREGKPADAGKEEPAISLDFIPVTEEETPEVVAEDIDKTDVAALEPETLDSSSEPVERTALMEEEIAEETLPSESAEETMLSDVSEETMLTEADAESMPAEEGTMAAEPEEETLLSARPDTFLDSSGPVVPEPDSPGTRETVSRQHSDEDIFADEEQDAEMEPENSTASAIPDHVLTPTLADIYFQQGQPQLALQIYRRLLDADPDNERIAKRIREIEAGMEQHGAGEPAVAIPERAAPAPAPSAPKAKPKIEKKKKASSAAKPLSGVRVRKKKAKSRRKKTR
jgi:pilus assembly protein FimV